MSAGAMPFSAATSEVAAATVELIPRSVKTEPARKLVPTFGVITI